MTLVFDEPVLPVTKDPEGVFRAGNKMRLLTLGASPAAAKLADDAVIYEVFVEGRLEVPKHRARSVHDLYFEPKYEEFNPRTIWSLSNAFTSAFKELDPVPQFKATAMLGEFLEARFAQSF